MYTRYSIHTQKEEDTMINRLKHFVEGGLLIVLLIAVFFLSIQGWQLKIEVKQPKEEIASSKHTMLPAEDEPESIDHSP